MTNHSFEDDRITPTSWGTLQTPLRPPPMDGADEDGANENSPLSETRITWPRATIPAKAVFGSLLTMGAFAAGVLFWMHSAVHSGEPPIASVGVAEMQATGGTVATSTATATPTPTPTSTATSVWTPTSMPTPTLAAVATASRTLTPKPMATSTPTAGTGPVHRAQAKSQPHVILYPFPVPPPAARIPTRGEPATEHASQDTAGTNPYDAVPAATTTSTERPAQALTAPQQPTSVPSNESFGGRE